MNEMTIANVAESLKTTPAELKKKLGILPMTANKTILTDEQLALVNAPAKTEAAPAPAESVPSKDSTSTVTENVVKEVKSSRVVFFWRNGKNMTFTIPGKLLLNGKRADGEFYKTKKSTLALDTVKDAEAIAWLKKRPGFEENGGSEFSLIGSNGKEDSREKLMDDLMKMEQAQLAQMAGGTVAHSRMTKGALILLILDEKAEESE